MNGMSGTEAEAGFRVACERDLSSDPPPEKARTRFESGAGAALTTSSNSSTALARPIFNASSIRSCLLNSTCGEGANTGSDLPLVLR